jgi:hypothetical protein
LYDYKVKIDGKLPASYNLYDISIFLNILTFLNIYILTFLNISIFLFKKYQRGENFHPIENQHNIICMYTIRYISNLIINPWIKRTLNALSLIMSQNYIMCKWTKLIRQEHRNCNFGIILISNLNDPIDNVDGLDRNIAGEIWICKVSEKYIVQYDPNWLCELNQLSSNFCVLLKGRPKTFSVIQTWTEVSQIP